MKRSKKYISAVMEGVRIQSVDQTFGGNSSITMSTGEASIRVEIEMRAGIFLLYANIAITPSTQAAILDSTAISKALQIFASLSPQDLMEFVSISLLHGDLVRKRMLETSRSSESEMGD